jgi:hypothetical protein
MYQRIASIRTAWAGEQPYTGTGQPIRLLTYLCIRLFEGRAIGLDTKHRNPAWAVTTDLTSELVSATYKLRWENFPSGRCGATDQARDSISRFEKIRTLIRR